jgi:hypothetical protein
MARRHRAAQDYARRGPQREPYDVVLVVCEGAKTEPFYFSGLIKHHRLSSANIHIMPANGTDPASIVQFALDKINDPAAAYDKVFCVFDRDGHDTFDAAIERIQNLPAGQAGTLIGIPSWPCFEFWLLLHFGYTDRPINAAGNKSSGARTLKALQEHFPAYTKGYATVFGALADKVDAAIRHGIRLQKSNSRTGSRNPSTKVHQLVSYLRALRRPES